MSSRKRTPSSVFDGSWRRSLCATLALLGVLALAPGVAQAGVQARSGPNFANTVTVGQTGIEATVSVSNANDGNETGLTTSVCNASDPFPCRGTNERGFTLTPACKQLSVSECGVPDPGVFQISSQGTGRAGSACPGMVFAIVPIEPTSGTVRFTPPPGQHVTLPGSGSSCIIDFTFDVLKSPTADQDPATPGDQTAQTTDSLHCVLPCGPGSLQARGLGTDNGTTVLRAQPTSITTTASAGTKLGSALTDNATVGGRVNPQPGATIVFTLFGPDDTTCTGTAIFTSTVPYPQAGGSVPSGSFTPTQPGVYRWVAAYTGDVNNAPKTGLCNDANETTFVGRATPTITTNASPDIKLGTAATLIDNATVGGRVNAQPGATIDFALFGPNDALCAGTPIFTSTVPYPDTGGSVPSDAFTPTLVGTYRWVASYSGDVNNASKTGLCNDANETREVTRAKPAITTNASADVVLGAGALHDNATVLQRQNPGASATIEFRLYGPNNGSCTGTPIFTSTVPYPAAGGSVPSASFTPTQLGTYRWIALYSGDVNNVPVMGACNDANENTEVTLPKPTITTVASADIVLGAGSLLDNATVSGRVSPQAGATIDFRLYGPGDATCTGAPAFTSANVAYPLAGGSVPSASFTPSQAGTYHWVATYSGDANNAPVTGACNDADEIVTVNAPPTPPPPATTPPPPPATTPPPTPAPVAKTAPASASAPTGGVANISSGGNTGCANKPFRVNVTGSQISRVVFTIDGDRIATLRRPNRDAKFSVLINPGKHKRGTHRVLARTTFSPSSGKSQQTMRVVFSRCAKSAPKFTG